MNNQLNEKLLRIAEVVEMTGLSHSTIYAWVAQGVFPRYIKLGPKCSAWKLSEINAWIEKCAAASAAQAQL